MLDVLRTVVFCIQRRTTRADTRACCVFRRFLVLIPSAFSYSITCIGARTHPWALGPVIDNAASQHNGLPIISAVFLLQSAGLGLQLRVYRGVPLVNLNAITPDKKVEVRPQVRFSFRVALCQETGSRTS